MTERKVQIINDKPIVSGETVKIHFLPNAPLTLKELLGLFDDVNKGINAVNRDLGIKNNATIGRDYAPKVQKISEGSIIVDIAIKLFQSVGISIIANCIYDQIKRPTMPRAKKAEATENLQNEKPISIVVNGDNNTIDIHIDN